MRLHLAQIAVVTDVVSDAVLIDVPPLHRPACNFFDYSERLQDRASILFAAAEIINFRCARLFPKLEYETGHVLGMNIVAELLTFVAEDLVLTSLEIAFGQITQKPVQFNTGVIGSCQTASAQTAGWHVVVPTILLDHDVSGELRGAEDGMVALVYRKILGNPVFESAIRVVSTCV